MIAAAKFPVKANLFLVFVVMLCVCFTISLMNLRKDDAKFDEKLFINQHTTETLAAFLTVV